MKYKKISFELFFTFACLFCKDDDIATYRDLLCKSGIANEMFQVEENV